MNAAAANDNLITCIDHMTKELEGYMERGESGSQEAKATFVSLQSAIGLANITTKPLKEPEAKDANEN